MTEILADLDLAQRMRELHRQTFRGQLAVFMRHLAALCEGIALELEWH